MRRVVSAALCLMIFMALSVFINCSDEGSPTQPPQPEPVICPLAVGNTWTYVDSVWQGGSPTTFSSSVCITGDTIITVDLTDYELYRWVHYDSMNQEETTLLVRNESSGLWEMGIACPTDTLIYRQLNAMYPAELDYTWTKAWYRCAMDQIMGLPPGTARCLAVDSLYTTPAGTFSCHLYHEQYDVIIFGLYDIYTFYAPNVGLVATEVQTDMVAWKSVLSSYTLK